jgi:hypothetical protein
MLTFLAFERDVRPQREGRTKRAYTLGVQRLQEIRLYHTIHSISIHAPPSSSSSASVHLQLLSHHLANASSMTAEKKYWTHPSEREDCESIPDSEKVTYEAFCHCKGVAYTVRLPRLDGPKPHNVSVCNCSICTKAGYLMVYPYADNFKLLKGEELLKSYQFASHRLRHRFCGECGSNLFLEIVTPREGEKMRVPCSVSISISFLLRRI